MGGLAAQNTACGPQSPVQDEAPCSVAQGTGGCSWLGWHLVRSKEPHPGATVVFWRNAEWWELMKGAGATSSDQSWRHPRNDWVRGFEGALVRFCGAGFVGSVTSHTAFLFFSFLKSLNSLLWPRSCGNLE